MTNTIQPVSGLVLPELLGPGCRQVYLDREFRILEPPHAGPFQLVFNVNQTGEAWVVLVIGGNRVQLVLRSPDGALEPIRLPKEQSISLNPGPAGTPVRLQVPGLPGALSFRYEGDVLHVEAATAEEG